MALKLGFSSGLNTITSSGLAMASGVGLNATYRRFVHTNNTEPIYIARHSYKRVWVFEARRLAAQAIGDTVRATIRKYQDQLRKKLAAPGVQQINNNRNALTELQQNGNKYATFKEIFLATDEYGDQIQDALFMAYDTGKVITYSKNKYKNGVLEADAKPIKSTFLCHIDINPRISQKSSKNIVVTQVQGRDYARKELISGGDNTFEISGEINSGNAYVYPEGAVKKFIQLMRYNGLITVQHRIFDMLGVKQVIIQSWDLPQPTYRNIQPYTITCIGIEPEEEIAVTMDTITSVNWEIATNDNKNLWYKLVLSKYGQALAEDTASVVTDAAAFGLSQVAPNYI